jgi:methyl-accepting chemotaxis protein
MHRQEAEKLRQEVERQRQEAERLLQQVRQQAEQQAREQSDQRTRLRTEADAQLADLRATLAQVEADRDNFRGLATGILSVVDTSYAHIEFDPQGTVLKANGNFCRLMGYGADEIVGLPHRTFVDAQYAGSQAYRDFWASLNSGQTQTAVFKRIAKGGREVWIQATYAPIRDDAGRIAKVLKIATDVTATKLESADFSGQLAAIGKSQAVIEFSLDGKVLTANENFLKTLGYSLPEIQGQHHSLFVDPAHRASAEYRMFWDRLGRGEFDAGQYKRIGKGGREIWIQASYNPIFDLKDRKSTRLNSSHNPASRMPSSA